MVAAKVIIKGPGLEPTIRRMEALARLRVKVGIIGAAAGDEHPGTSVSATVAQIAAIHEFGAPDADPPIPERSFLRSTMVEQEKRFGRLLASAGIKVAKGMAPVAALSLVGEAAKGAVQRRIVTGPFVPNSPVTVAKKGSSRPLIDTGQLRQSVSYEVVDKGAVHGAV